MGNSMSGTQFSFYLKNFSSALFAELKQGENLGLSVHSEQSQFFRFNQSRVRQNTHVHQHEITLTYHKDLKSIRMQFSLVLDSTLDLSAARNLLKTCRTEIEKIDPGPQFVPMQNHGTSESFFTAVRPTDSEILDFITSELKDDDAAGLLTSGPLRKASINSLGQFHFFESDQFFFDYSIYNGPRAAKGFYSAQTWNEIEFKDQIRSTRQKLSMLSAPQVQVQKGKHRVFLEPMAVAELVGTLGWGAFSLNAYQQGRAPLRKLKENTQHFNSQFSLTENLGLGYAPRFNSLGELAPESTPLIENGKLSTLLVSSASSKEYGVPSNFAEPSEVYRSPEIRAGTLSKQNALKELGTGLYLSNLHYINWSDLQTARITGMTRFACFWVERGEIKGPIQDLRFDETLYNIFGDKLVSLTKEQESFCDTATYVRRSLGGLRVPGALIEEFNFTL